MEPFKVVGTYMRAKETIYYRAFITLTCVVAYFSLVYINYNAPVFKQIFAHKFYASTGEETDKRSGVCTLSACISTRGGLPLKNKIPECSSTPNRAGITPYTYTVSGKNYDAWRVSYLYYGRACVTRRPPVYYFPLFPSWSVFNKDMPSGKVWDSYLKSTKGMLALLLLYLVIIAFSLNRKCSYESVLSAIQQDKKTYIFIGAVFYPLLVTAMLSLLSVFVVFWDFANGADRHIRNFFMINGAIVYMAIAYVPTFVLLCLRFMEKGKLKYVISFGLVFVHLFLHLVLLNKLSLWLS